MTKLARLWTASIAYVALAAGAGLSIMYNVLQTMATRGALFSMADAVTAVAMPLLVVLMVELAVSRFWIGAPWYGQAVRVLATAGIGGVAMYASWTHGHAWLLAHGHDAIVATTWPLAIDLLAILATALILAGRVAKGRVTETVANVHAVATATNGHGGVATGDVQYTPWPPRPADELATATQTAATDWDRELAMMATHVEDVMARDEEERVATATPVRTTAGARVPDDVRELIQAWNPVASGLTSRELDVLIGAHAGRSERTARRWRYAVLGGPTSGAPVSTKEEK